MHKHDSVQPEGGKIAEDIDFDLSVVHKRVGTPPKGDPIVRCCYPYRASMPDDTFSGVLWATCSTCRLQTLPSCRQDPTVEVVESVGMVTYDTCGPEVA